MPKLPKEILALVEARNALTKRYGKLKRNGQGKLDFTFDGKLMGDLGEVIACKRFNLTLAEAGRKGVDALTRKGRDCSD